MVSNIWVAAADNELELVKKYITSGEFTANSQDPNGYTPIHAAVSYGHKELLQYLIENGGNINVQDVEGDTPLHHVEDITMAKLLVQNYKADWTIKNQDGQTAIEYIEEEDEYPEIAQYLRSLNHDNPNENILDTLPRPDEVDSHKIRYTYQSVNENDDLTIDIDDAKRLQLKEIVESENPEERLTEFLKGQLINNNSEALQQPDSPASKKRKE